MSPNTCRPCPRAKHLSRPSTSSVRCRALKTWMPATSAGMTKERTPFRLIFQALAPDADARGARGLLGGLQLGRSICAGAAAAVEQHDAREILIVDPAAMLAAVAYRLADDLAPPQIAAEIARRPTAHAFHTVETHDAPLNLQRGGVEHKGGAADGIGSRRRHRGRRRRRGCASRGTAGARRRRLRAGNGRPRGRLRDEIVPDARRQIAPSHVPHRAVVIVADPDTDHDVAGKPDEPGVAIFLRGPGLPDGPRLDPRRFPGLLADHLAQPVADFGAHRGLTG